MKPYSEKHNFSGWMLSFFTSYRRRIIRKITELEAERVKLILERDKCKITLSPADYIPRSLKVDKINSDIKLLKSLL